MSKHEINYTRSLEPFYTASSEIFPALRHRIHHSIWMELVGCTDSRQGRTCTLTLKFGIVWIAIFYPPPPNKLQAVLEIGYCSRIFRHYDSSGQKVSERVPVKPREPILDLESMREYVCLSSSPTDRYAEDVHSCPWARHMPWRSPFVKRDCELSVSQ